MQKEKRYINVCVYEANLRSHFRLLTEALSKRKKVSMERNKAYELHKPLSQAASSEKGKTMPPIYEELHM